MKTGYIVRYKSQPESEELIIMEILDDYGQQTEFCKVRNLGVSYSDEKKIDVDKSLLEVIEDDPLSPFARQNLFYMAMLDAWNKGKMNPIYKPYMDWKSGKGTTPTKEEALQIKETASAELEVLCDKYEGNHYPLDTIVDSNPWQNYRDYEDECRIVSYLEQVKHEIFNFIY